MYKQLLKQALIPSLLMLLFLSCGQSKKTAHPNEATLTGKTWTVTDLEGTSVTAGQFGAPTIHFEEAGKLTGNTGCNRYSGIYIMNNNSLQLDPGMMTKMFCEGSVENKFLEALKKANRFAVSGDELMLYEGAVVIMKLTSK